MPDPIELEVFKNLYHSIAEEMGAALRRTAFSPNIKERRDYSCAVFDARGQVIAMGDHMPVHLGSMPMSVAAAIEQCKLNGSPLEPGDVVMLNDPFRGGTHLPDITLVMPVFVSPLRGTRRDSRPRLSSGAKPRSPAAGHTTTPDFYVASRAHHADVGGTYPGSMGPCREIYQEGFRIPPVKIMRGGKIVPDILALLLNNVRTPEEREGDLGAQIAACQTGAQRLAEICARYGKARAHKAAAGLIDYSHKLMRSFLLTIPPGKYQAEDFLDDDGADNQPVRIAVTISVPPKVPVSSMSKNLEATSEERLAKSEQRTTKNEGRKTNEKREARSDQRSAVLIDFTGSDPQVQGAVNAVEAITYSACFYVFRCLLREDVPTTAGLMRDIRVIAPLGTVVNARPPAAVAGGNVETSQRIVDVLLRALAKAIPDRIPAAAAGTMNNLTIGGMDWRGNDSRAQEQLVWGRGSAPSLRKAKAEKQSAERITRSAKSEQRKAGDPQPFAYYETIAGGMGARPTKDGVSGVHTHMTNSLNTPVEALESAYPLRVRQYSLRPHSGGQGLHTGGDGIIREIEVLTDAQVTLLADRRTRGPYGLSGGEAGAQGRTTIIRKSKQARVGTAAPGCPAGRSPAPAENVSREGLGKGTASAVPLDAATNAALAAEGEGMESPATEEELPGKTSVRLHAGDRIRIESPGGGGWGKPRQ